MMPMFFGPNESQLYGVYHPPAGAGLTGRGVVLCNPLGQEALRAHRAYRVLADAMARERWHVFRFDYSGTGDSWGCIEESTIEAWKSDIGYAIDELKAIVGIRSIYLLGLRLGATLAATVAAQRSDVKGVVLWEPICDGDEYIKALVGDIPKSVYTDSEEVDGFVLSRRLSEEIAHLQLLPCVARLPRHILVVQSSETRNQTSLRSILDDSTCRYEYLEIPDPAAWTEENNFGAGPIPARVVNSIANWHPTFE